MTKQIPQHLRAVLDKLASDDVFRAQLTADPVATLASIGVTLDPADVPALRTLPSKASVAVDQAAVQDQLGNNMAMVPFLLSGQN